MPYCRLVEQPCRLAMECSQASGMRKRCEREPQAVQLIADPDLPGVLALVHDHVVFVWLSCHAG